MRHAGPVGIAKQLIAHVERRFKRSDFAEAGARLWLKRPGDMSNGIEAPKALRNEVVDP